MRSGKEIPESGMPPWDMRPVSGILEFPVEPEESESYMNIGDSVIMNEKYVVAEKNQGKVFTVRSQHFDICGTECVMLEGYSGGYAVDGLTVVGKRISGREAVASYSAKLIYCEGREAVYEVKSYFLLTCHDHFRGRDISEVEYSCIFLKNSLKLEENI